MTEFDVLALTLILVFFLGVSEAGFTATPTLSSLLTKHAADIAFLKEKASAAGAVSLPSDDIFYLRYCIAFDGTNKKRGDISDGADALIQNMQWRNGEGNAICKAARTAVGKATSQGDQWDNSPVRDAAPHASAVNKYITASQVLTTSSRQGDLVYCIRAGKIDDAALMSEVSIEEMVEFFLYCKEVQALVADDRSSKSDRLVSVITANDLSGVSLLSDDTFRKALSQSSSKATELFPSLSGPTLLLNLPTLLGALAKLFTPLFPAEVRKRLKFEQGPLKDIDDLTDILRGDARAKFLSEIDGLVYQE